MPLAVKRKQRDFPGVGRANLLPRAQDLPMLILTRRAGESLHIGDNIKITVFSIQGKQVKLGIVVPDDVVVYREEVYLRIKEENRQALLTDNNDLLAAAALWQDTVRK